MNSPLWPCTAWHAHIYPVCYCQRLVIVFHFDWLPFFLYHTTDFPSLWYQASSLWRSSMDYFKDRQPCWPLNRGLGATRHLSYPSESWVEKEHSSQKDDSGSPEGPQFCLWFGVKLGPRITSQCQLQKPLLAYCLPQRDTPSEYSAACSSLPCWHGIELSRKLQLNGLRTGCTLFASTEHLHMKYHKVTEILLLRFHIILLL